MQRPFHQSFKDAIDDGSLSISVHDTDPTRDAPALTDEDEPEDFSDVDLDPQPYVAPFDSMTEAIAAGDMLGFERGYTAGFEDGVQSVGQDAREARLANIFDHSTRIGYAR